MAIDLTSAERRRMGDRLRAARNLTDLSLRAVGEKVGLSLTAVGEWERRGYTPPPAAQAILADLYDVPEAVLFAEYHRRRAQLLAALGDRQAS